MLPTRRTRGDRSDLNGFCTQRMRGQDLQGDDMIGGTADLLVDLPLLSAGKGATYYGVGSAVARLVDVLLHDQRAILTICSRIENVASGKRLTTCLTRPV